MSVLETIRIDLGAEISGPGPGAGRRHGIFEYSCVRYPRVRGYSRQPLLDACRKLKALCGLTGERVGLFRKGRSESDLSCVGLPKCRPDTRTQRRRLSVSLRSLNHPEAC
jgi:hypothetical protein